MHLDAGLQHTGAARGLLEWYGHWRRHCIEAHSVDENRTKRAEKIFHLHFSVVWMGSRSTFVLHCHCFCGFRDRLALDVEGTCELAERFGLVHHIPEAAISDWYIRRSLRGAHSV